MDRLIFNKHLCFFKIHRWKRRIEYIYIPSIP